MLINLFGIYFHIFELPLIAITLFTTVLEFAQKGIKLEIRYPLLVFGIFTSLALFICAVLLSSINALDQGLVIKATIKWLEVLAIAFLLLLYIKDEKRFHVVYLVLFLSVFSAIVNVLIGILSGERSILTFRVFPSYESAFAFALILPCWSEKKNWSIGFLLTSLIAVLLSLSRGAWLATTAVFVHSFFYLQRRLKRRLVIGTAIIILTGCFIPDIRELFNFRFETISSDIDASNVERLALYRIAWHAFSEHPIFGVGALNFPHFFIREGLLEGISAEKIDLLQPHNTFLQIAAEEGLFGLFFFCLLIITSWVLMRKSKSINLYLYYGLMGFFIVMMFNFVFGYIAGQFRFYLGILIGLILALSRISNSRDRENAISI